jgi:hypothetical protein
MSEQVCFCGLRLNGKDKILYYIDDVVCCNVRCLDEAINGVQPLDRDGYMCGAPQVSEK